MRPDPVLSMLGLAAKAGKIVSGEFATEQAIKADKACLVVIAKDASDNTTKKFILRSMMYQFLKYNQKIHGCVYLSSSSGDQLRRQGFTGKLYWKGLSFLPGSCG